VRKELMIHMEESMETMEQMAAYKPSLPVWITNRMCNNWPRHYYKRIRRKYGIDEYLPGELFLV